MIYKKTAAVVSFFVVLVLPAVTMAQIGIPCSGTDCTFEDLVTLANNIVKFLVFSVSVPLAALGFMWAGASLILNQNKEGAWSEAKERFGNIGMGFGIILAAFLLVKLVLYAFLNTEAGFTAFLLQ
ncbi:MAG: hypothetical protein ACYCZ7_02740 [Minisyncoccota bacterium]